jgi:hypothetical protein
MTAMDMKQLYTSMENTIKLQGRARAAKRAREAEQEQKEFKEKLMRIANSQIELESMAKKVKGTDAAVQRDQLIGLMGVF